MKKAGLFIGFVCVFLLCNSCAIPVWKLFLGYSYSYDDKDIQIDGTDFSFSFFPEVWPAVSEGFHTGSYRFLLGIQPPEDKWIKSVVINDAMISVGEAHFHPYITSMRIYHDARQHWSDLFGDRPYNPYHFTSKIEERELNYINTHGIIHDFDAYTLRTDRMNIGFEDAWINLEENKKMMLYINLSVEYATGEIITLDHEFTVAFKLKLYSHVYPWFWLGTV